MALQVCGEHNELVHLLEYQAAHGFAGASEFNVRRLYEALGYMQPEPIADEDIPLDFQLSIYLVQHMKPELSHAKLLELMPSRVAHGRSVVGLDCEDIFGDYSSNACLRYQDH